MIGRRPRDRRVAHPDDTDLIVDYRGVVLGTILVCDRSIYVEHTVAEGWLGTGPNRRDAPAEGWIEATISYLSLDEGQFVALVQELEEWAASGAVLHYVAARRRLSALFDEDGTFLPLPNAVIGGDAD